MKSSKEKLMSSKRSQCSNLELYFYHKWDIDKVIELLFNFASQQAEPGKGVQALGPRD